MCCINLSEKKKKIISTKKKKIKNMILTANKTTFEIKKLDEENVIN